MLRFGSASILEISAYLAIPSALVMAYAAVRKLGPEKNALYITSAQGAAVIMDNLVSTLRVEIDRCRAEAEHLTEENERLKAELARCRDARTGT